MSSFAREMRRGVLSLIEKMGKEMSEGKIDMQ